MTGHELLLIVGVPALFMAAGVFGYFLVERDTRRFDLKQKRTRAAH